MEGCSRPYHSLQNCQVFRMLSVEQRIDKIGKIGLCVGRLTVGHGTSARTCPYQEENSELWLHIDCCTWARVGEGESSGSNCSMSVPSPPCSKRDLALCDSGWLPGPRCS
jgi:hypothetical protein